MIKRNEFCLQNKYKNQINQEGRTYKGEEEEKKSIFEKFYSIRGLRMRFISCNSNRDNKVENK